MNDWIEDLLAAAEEHGDGVTSAEIDAAEAAELVAASFGTWIKEALFPCGPTPARG